LSSRNSTFERERENVCGRAEIDLPTFELAFFPLLKPPVRMTGLPRNLAFIALISDEDRIRKLAVALVLVCAP